MGVLEMYMETSGRYSTVQSVIGQFQLVTSIGWPSYYISRAEQFDVIFCYGLPSHLAANHNRLQLVQAHILGMASPLGPKYKNRPQITRITGMRFNQVNLNQNLQRKHFTHLLSVSVVK